MKNFSRKVKSFDPFRGVFWVFRPRLWGRTGGQTGEKTFSRGRKMTFEKSGSAKKLAKNRFLQLGDLRCY